MKNILTKIILFLLISAFAFTLASCNKSDEYAPPSGYVTATDEKADFYLYVPDEWTVDYSTAAAGAYYSTDDPSSVSVMAWELEYSDTTLEEWWEMNVDEISLVFSDVEIENVENATIDGIYANKYTYTGTLGENSYKFLQAACIKNGTVYLFTYSSTADNFDLHTEDVNSMIEYIRLK